MMFPPAFKPVVSTDSQISGVWFACVVTWDEGQLNTKFGLMQRVPWRIAEGSLSIAGDANSTSWGMTHPRPFPLPHIFVMILITWFEPEFLLNLHLGSLLTFHRQKDVEPLSASLSLSLWDMWSTYIRKNQPAIVPQLPVLAFCEGPS